MKGEKKASGIRVLDNQQQGYKSASFGLRIFFSSSFFPVTRRISHSSEGQVWGERERRVIRKRIEEAMFKSVENMCTIIEG